MLRYRRKNDGIVASSKEAFTLEAVMAMGVAMAEAAGAAVAAQAEAADE
jgi:hypothetical protein